MIFWAVWGCLGHYIVYAGRTFGLRASDLESHMQGVIVFECLSVKQPSAGPQVLITSTLMCGPCLCN